MDMPEIKEIERKCPVDGRISVVRMLASDYERWQNGELLQRAAPEMPVTEREKLITGLCDECQAPIFDYPEED